MANTDSPIKPASHQTQVQQQLLVHASTVRAFVLGMTISRDLADDVMQEVFLRVTAKADDFEMGTDFLAWACTVARYVVLEQLRAGRGVGPALPPDVIESLADAFEPAAPIDERIDLLRFCMHRLSPSARRIIDLRYRESLKSGEIAQRIGMNPASVYTALTRARVALRDCVEAKLERGKP